MALKKALEIVREAQITDDSCVAACLAMVTGKNQAEIIAELGNPVQEDTALKWLVRNDILPIQAVKCFTFTPSPEEIYLVISREKGKEPHMRVICGALSRVGIVHDPAMKQDTSLDNILTIYNLTDCS